MKGWHLTIRLGKDHLTTTRVIIKLCQEISQSNDIPLRSIHSKPTARESVFIYTYIFRSAECHILIEFM